MPAGPIDDPALRSLFASGPVRGLFEHEATLQRYLDVEAALARVEAGLGLIPAQAAEAISGAARVENLDPDRYAAEVASAFHPLVPLLDQLKEAVAEGMGEWVHWGATTQDVIDTAHMLQIGDGLTLIEERLRRVEAALKRLAEEHRHTVMAGRSMLQQAVPITFGYKAAGWAAMVGRMLDRLPALRDEVLVVQLGGAAGNLSAFGSHGTEVRTRLAAELGLADPGITWHTARDRIADTVQFLALVCAVLAKIGTDLAHLAQTEVGEVAELGSGGSTAMPQKRNPVRSQLLMVAARLTRRMASAALEAVVADHERGTGVWMTEWWAVPEAFAVTGGALEQAVALAEGLEVDPARMTANLAAGGGLLMSEAVAVHLAPRMGRAAARRLLQALARRAAEERSDLRTALLASEEAMQHLTAEEVDLILDPARYLGSTDDMIDFVLRRSGGC